jgi:hypothetical protein
MERRLRIFEMTEDADPIALAESQLLSDPFPRDYANTRARRALDLRAGRTDDAALWAFTMLPTGELVSRVLAFLFALLIPVAPACSEASPDSRRWCTWTPLGPIRPRPGPRHARARRDSSGSGRRIRRRGGAGRTSAGSGGMRISGCRSNWGFPPRRRHSSCRRRRRKKTKKKKKDGGMFSPTGGSPHPRHQSRLRW